MCEYRLLRHLRIQGLSELGHGKCVYPVSHLISLFFKWFIWPNYMVQCPGNTSNNVIHLARHHMLGDWLCVYCGPILSPQSVTGIQS